MRLLFTSIIFILTFYSTLQAELSYDITKLNPPDSISSAATDINELGQVTGYYHKKNDNTPYLFLWDKEKGFQLLGEAQTTPLINNLGHIVTSKNVGFSKDRPYLWTPEKGEQLLDIPAGLTNEILNPVAINDHDQILFRNNYKYSAADKVWVWEDNNFREIKDLTSANHLTNDQLIAGVVCIKPSLHEKVYLPTFYDLGTNVATPLVFPGKKTITGYIKMFNEEGMALGRIYDVAGKKQFYFTWSQKTGIKYHENFDPLWINNDGDMIGWKLNSIQNLTEVFLFDGTKYKNIEIEAGIGYDMEIEFRAISLIFKFNTQRQIVGQGRIVENGEWKYHAFIIEPKKNK